VTATAANGRRLLVSWTSIREVRVTRLGLVFAVSISAPLAACTSVDSDNILTSGMYADIRATATGDGDTTVRTTLYLENPGSLNFIELEGGDQLIAYAPDGDSQIMRQAQFLGITNYSARFEIDDSGSEFIVELSRIVDEGAPDSRVFLPEGFDILNPEDEAYSRAADDIVLEWDPFDTGDDMDVVVTGNCIQTYSVGVEGDPGVAVIEAGSLVKSEGDTVPDDCDLVVEITRSTPGDVDPAYGFGGVARGQQVRTVGVVSSP
jgi:hypothetical protein